ncbi:MAG: Gfo/Idh/MocA family oxidoreductase [Balneolaceae bacterium]|nr:Gfo/Idh/MocA family oxidoreductase [Balneolaceae bacterium]
MEINCHWNRDERYYKEGDWHGTLDMDGGTLFTQFSHFVDIMYWVFGDIKNISARFRNFNHQQMIEFEDSGIVNFTFASGAEGSIHYTTSCWDKNMESSMTVLGEKGSLKIGGQYMDEIEYCHIEDYEMPELPPTNPPNDYGPFTGSAANHHYVIENVLDTLSGKSQIKTSAREGMKVVDIIERIYRHREDLKAEH